MGAAPVRTRKGGKAVVWHHLGPRGSRSVPGPAGPLPAHLPPARGAGPQEANTLHPLSIHLQAPSGRVHAHSTRGWGTTASLAGRFIGKVVGFIKPWSSAGSSNCISELCEGPCGLCLPFISLPRGSPKASTRLTRLLRMYAQGWWVLVGAEGQRVCLAESPSRIHT